MKALALATLLFGFTVTRDGVEPIVWDPAQVTVRIHADGSDDIDDGSDFAVLREALAAWSATCSDFAYVEGALFTGPAVSGDGINTISFTENAGDWPYGAGVVGFAPEIIDTGSPRRRQEADVFLNGVDYQWATDGAPSRPDIGGVATHELGHALGLWHSSDTDATMYFGSKLGGTQARILGVDDIRGLCFLYPVGTFQCVADEDCPLYNDAVRTVCDAGSCIVGFAGYGLDCSVAAQCQSNVCIAARYTPGVYAGNPGFCSQACDLSGQDCPTGLCSDYSGSPLCYPHREDCVLDRETEVDECGDPGDPWACMWDLDLVQRCLHLCDTDAHCSSVAGTVCHAGYCRTPGTIVAGDSCTNSAECESLQCGGSGPVCQALPSMDDGAPDGGVDGGDPLPGDPTGDPTGGDPTPDGDGLADGGDITLSDGGGDPAGGDPLPGDPWVGDPLVGDPLPGDPWVGDPLVGDPLAGDPLAGDPLAGDPLAGDPLAGDPLAGDPLAGDPLAGDPLGGDPGDPVGDASSGDPRLDGGDGAMAGDASTGPGVRQWARGGCACGQAGWRFSPLAAVGCLVVWRRRRRR